MSLVFPLRLPKTKHPHAFLSQPSLEEGEHGPINTEGKPGPPPPLCTEPLLRIDIGFRIWGVERETPFLPTARHDCARGCNGNNKTLCQRDGGLSLDFYS